MNNKHYASVDELIAEIAHLSIEDIANEPWEGPRLISVDVLRAAGALDVPPSWRKSLGKSPTKEQTRYRSLFEDDELEASGHDEVEIDSEDESSADEDDSSADENE